jgi:hypothetical protein
MDPANISWLEADTDDSYWEAYYRRTYSEGYWERVLAIDLALPGYYEEVGDDLGRRERMAEAMYEC